MTKDEIAMARAMERAAKLAVRLARVLSESDEPAPVAGLACMTVLAGILRIAPAEAQIAALEKLACDILGEGNVEVQHITVPADDDEPVPQYLN